MAHVAVELDERTGIAESHGALAREQLALRMLALDGLLAAGVFCLFLQLGKPRELRLGRLVRALFLGLRHREEPTIAR